MASLVQKFERRDIYEVALANFHQATQNSVEELLDQGDRVQDLADRALKGLPRDQWCRQVVVRFCQGLLDKEARHNTLLRRPEDIQEATEMVKEHQF